MRSLQTLLKSDRVGVVGAVQKLQSSQRAADKLAREALRDLATCEVQVFKTNHPKNLLWCHHRRLADLDYLNALVSCFDDEVSYYLRTTLEVAEKL